MENSQWLNSEKNKSMEEFHIVVRGPNIGDDDQGVWITFLIKIEKVNRFFDRAVKKKTSLQIESLI